MLFRFISGNGLYKFSLDGLKEGVALDIGAIRQMLEKTGKLTKLSIRNANNIDAQSHGELITMISDLIQSEPPKLEELDFCGIGGPTEQGSQVLQAIYDSEMQFKTLDISNNP